MLGVILIVCFATIWSVVVAVKEDEWSVFLLVALASLANLGFGYYIIRGSYMVREVMPKKKIEYLLTVVSIVFIVMSIVQIDTHVFAKIEVDEQGHKPERTIVHAWNVAKWELYLYKAHLALWFLRYIFIMKRKNLIL